MDLSVRPQIGDIIKGAALADRDRRVLLSQIVGDHWGPVPSWALEHPVIEIVQKATVGSGAVLTFEENGVRKVVLAEAGPHYKQAAFPQFMIPGGFVNLVHTEGSSFVPESDKPESPRIAMAREGEEEFRYPDGTPLFTIDPARLKPMDMNTLLFPWGEVRIVLGAMMELTAQEVTRAKEHVARLAADPVYKEAVAGQTKNKDSGKPEVSSVAIFDLKDVAEGRCPLYHPDQKSLFVAVQDHFKASQRVLTRRLGPTHSYKQKVKTLGELTSLVEKWRQEGDASIGITSGVFDLLHPGHISFLEDAWRNCSHLIAVVASDRTVQDQKGEEKPYVTEMKRAQTLAALEMVDAVIISDEPYHETILKAVKPDILFKGDDYAGKEIIGADLVGHVMLIPCAEKEFYSSSAFARKIKTGERDQPPVWAGPTG